MKKIIFLSLLFTLFIACDSNEPNACVMSIDFIKEDLTFPDEAEFSTLDCNYEKNADGSYTVLKKVQAKNAFGVKTSFIYKVTLGFTGGVPADIDNWYLIDIKSEEYR